MQNRHAMKPNIFKISIVFFLLHSGMLHSQIPDHEVVITASSDQMVNFNDYITKSIWYHELINSMVNYLLYAQVGRYYSPLFP